MKYAIYAGGNKINRAENGDSFFDAANTASDVRMASHVKTRHKVVGFHLDLNGELMGKWFKSKGITKLTAATADELATHLLPAGARIRSLSVQVRRPVTGVTANMVISGVVGNTPPALVGGVTVDAATDATAATTGNAGTETDLAPVFAVDLSKEGWHYFEPNVTLQDEGDIAFRPLQDLAAGCFSIFVELVDLASEHGCECASPPCNVTYGPVKEC
jgi:hypothetical protein